MTAPTPTQLIDRVTLASEALAGAVADQHAAHDALDLHRLAFVNSLLGTPNATTGKPHSLTSCEVAADASPEGRLLILAVRDAAATVARASCGLTVARLRAELAVRSVGAL